MTNIGRPEREYEVPAPIEVPDYPPDEEPEPVPAPVIAPAEPDLVPA